VAQAQLEQARAALEQANANLSRTLITAPAGASRTGLLKN
jgi:multidrug resistance efflux pump